MESPVRGLLGDPVLDPDEEAFLVFSQAIPSQSLGFIDSKASSINIEVAGRDLTISHSRGLLTSDRKAGTTGAVVWKVTPLFAEWIASTNFLVSTGYVSPDSSALELGTGVSGIVALTLGTKIKRYIATDQDYVIRLLQHNITENLPVPPTTAPKRKSDKHKKSKPTSRQPVPDIQILQLDWELDSVNSLPTLLSAQDGVDLIIACDCVYNDALIEPLNNTCEQICRLRANDSTSKPTLCLIAQQLRAPDVFEAWLKSFHRRFHVWKVPDELLTEPLRENSGFIVHVGILR
ncbi:hypothetical protein B0J11DRAFT_61101 [Dendryphion nanum]|uniref:Diaminohydroxyphosphoribosylamino-pyrimidine deaminase n=1 Tax=Dendryphion nanum TaxID=256645 RepID=A0A9P9DLL2_9PLEO|nr:hypothetical protein B0J11DRAFT_61101 [Dendryphion nanum]